MDDAARGNDTDCGGDHDGREEPPEDFSRHFADSQS